MLETQFLAFFLTSMVDARAFGGLGSNSNPKSVVIVEELRF
jgi:hypothetical protein